MLPNCKVSIDFAEILPSFETRHVHGIICRLVIKHNKTAEDAALDGILKSLGIPDLGFFEETFTGVAVCHPEDDFDRNIGRKLSFKRAVEDFLAYPKGATKKMREDVRKDRKTLWNLLSGHPEILTAKIPRTKKGR